MKNLRQTFASIFSLVIQLQQLDFQEKLWTSVQLITLGFSKEDLVLNLKWLACSFIFGSYLYNRLGFIVSKVGGKAFLHRLSIVAYKTSIPFTNFLLT